MSRPNVVCIMTDDTDFSRIACYGGDVPTPNIDRIAKAGVTFNQAYCASSVCTPSRYNYLTGQYAGRCIAPHFLADNPIDEPYRVTWNAVVTEDNPSLARILSDNGYRTGFVGKWHTGRSLRQLDIPTFSAQDDPDDPDVNAKLIRYQDALQKEVARTAGFDYTASVVWGNLDAGMPIEVLSNHNMEWMTQGALDFLDGCDSEQPFFLMYASTIMHGPLQDESIDVDVRYSHGGWFECPPKLLTKRQTVKQRLKDAGLAINHHNVGMMWIDDQVGFIFDKLDALGLTENTFIVFCTDHNTEAGKSTVYQKGTRIPFVAMWPDHTQPGTQSDVMIQNVDFAATVLDVAGINKPATMDGVSFRHVLEGDSTPLHNDLFFEMGYARAVYSGRWKYVALRFPERLLTAMQAGELEEAPNQLNQRLQGQANIAAKNYPAYFDPDQLYDLENDPHEQHNLAAAPECADILVALRARLQSYVSTFTHPFPLGTPDFMLSDKYQALTEKTRAIGTDHIHWYDPAIHDMT